MAQQATEWSGMRLTPTQKAKIKRLAERKGSTQKAAVLEHAQDLCGSLEGPEDLSTNPKYIKDYGKD